MVSNLDRLLESDGPGAATVAWMVQISAGELTESRQREFEAWRHSDEANSAAWERLTSGVQPFRAMSRAGLASSNAPGYKSDPALSRRALLGGVGATAIVGASLAIGHQMFPLDQVFSDHRTATGEQTRLTLQDGSEIVLAPRSAFNVSMRPPLRRIDFLGGEALLKAWPVDVDPFVARLGDLEVAILDGQILLERRSSQIAVTGISGSSELRYLNDVQKFVEAGQRFVLDAGKLTRTEVNPGIAASWTTGRAMMLDQSVDAIVDKIRPYFRGIIDVDVHAGKRRASGLFDLFHPVDSLRALAKSVGLNLEQTSSFWIRIGLSN